MITNVENAKFSIPALERYHFFKPFTLENPKSLNIVMIDDNPKDIDLVFELISLQSVIKAKFTAYTDSLRGIQYISECPERIDLIILDLVMPGISGVKACKLLQWFIADRNTSVIIHSSMNNYTHINETKDLGVHAFFEKPLDLDAFEHYVFGMLI